MHKEVVMSRKMLLDCTLRDGAYLIDKTFGDDNIEGIIKGLVKSKIDFIEVGFFQNDGFGEGKTVFRNSEDVARFIPNDKKGCRFTVLADCSRYDVANLDNRRSDSIDAVRECFFKHEMDKAMENSRIIKEKGYLLFVQPVDILGYSEAELLELINRVNDIEPFCISIVDTFGSMYQEDLQRVFELFDRELLPGIGIGFHSHNNMQLSNSLSQEFLRLSSDKRTVVVDGTLSGMGRGAGNTPTELIAQYMVSKLKASYDLDAILDILDTYMENIKSRCSWGYNTPYFVAGCYSAHVNNIAFLQAKNSIRSKDIRYILNKIGSDARKRYDYSLLEETYMEYLNSDIDDSTSLEKLRDSMSGKPVLVLAPGSTLKTESEKIKKFIENKKPVVISINLIPEEYDISYLYLSNLKRYEFWSRKPEYKNCKKIITSNVSDDCEDDSYVINFIRYIKCGFEHMDNSTMMVLRLLDVIKPESISLAGFDGYDIAQNSNYYSQNLELSHPKQNAVELNSEIQNMLSDYMNCRVCKDVPVEIITESRFHI